MSGRPYVSSSRLILCLFAASVACRDTGNAGETAFARRDSAGITIAENTVAEPVGVPHWVIDTTPAVTIGVTEGDPAYEFTNVSGVRQLPNGMIALLNGIGELAYEIRFFDSTGKHVATHGRRGQGPGEFRTFNFFGSVGGDTIIGVDWPQARINWVSATAGFLRSARLDELQFKEVLGADASGIIETLVPLGDSVYATTAYRRIPGAPAIQRRETYHIVDMKSRTTLDLGGYDEGERKAVELSSGRTHVRKAGAGDPMHVVDRDRRRICAAVTNVAEIRCLDSDGSLLRIRWRVDPLPFTAADREAREAAVRRSVRPGGTRTVEDANRLIAAMEWPENHLPFDVLLVDVNGNLWVREIAADPAGRRRSRFRVFDREGRHVAFADQFPARNINSRVAQHLGNRAVVRIIEGADGAPMVAVYPIRKER